MAKTESAPLQGARRARHVIITGAALVALAAVVVVAFGSTSTYWFCAEVCHKVQDDAILAYGHSSHSRVSCMSCHEPVNADPITFTLKKTKSLGELVLTVRNDYELPLNARSELSENPEEMPSEQCTQCHDLSARRITPSSGIIIDHDVHEKNGIQCTMCHNRVAHKEDFTPKLTDPKSSKKSVKHEDHMLMEGCYRDKACHGLEAGHKAPGTCATCHPSDFELKPENHVVAGFYQPGGDSSGHWKLKEQRPGYCRTCHLESEFCSDCHGLEMPHPKDFVKTHGDVGRKSPKVCAKCHAKGEQARDAVSMRFCNSCHHKDADPTRDWIPQHFEEVQKNGAEACFECHDPTYCAKCHVKVIVE
ncbi:MAG: hypothetical protein ABFC80_06895 [Coriobacteriales bacterium]